MSRSRLPASSKGMSVAICAPRRRAGAVVCVALACIAGAAFIAWEAWEIATPRLAVRFEPTLPS
ncbi:MAG TPA: hypothetical protein VNO21_20510, partial [Polyangiaceae bacterium]|nr:hypothetical protein [Polyangiaceae bacterium]